jgi:hypothetical protein
MDNHNPFLKVNDPFEPQREQQDKVKKELIEFQRLCFEVFHMHKDGIKLYELIKERYITRSLFAPTQPNASELALYYEGFKEALRGLWNQGRTHQMRINGELS